MEELKLTTEMIMVMGMIGVAIFLFVVEWVRVDVVAILMMVSLPLLKLVKPEEAFIGLSSNAVVSIIAVIIIGAGLDKTGLINRLVSPILRLAGQNPSRIMIFISGTVAFISSFMQNIGAAALFLPAIQRISKQTRIPLSRLLMPIGFCAILGGTITLVGSSPLILLNDLIKPFNLKPFSLFSVTPVGLALVASGILYFIFFGRFVLPKHHEEEDQAGAEGGLFSEAYARLGRPHELKAPNPFNSHLTMQMMRDQYLVHLVGLARQHSGEKNFAPERETRVEAGDSLAVIGPDSNVHRLAQEYGFTVKDELDVFKEDMSASRTGMVEAVVAPRSHLVGKTMRQVFFRKMYQVNPLAIYRADKTFYAGLSDIVLKPGDTILLQGTWERFNILKEHKEFLLSTPVETELLRPEKAVLAGFWLAVALVMIMVFKIQLSVCLMTGALGMIITRVLSIDEAYRSVDWRTIFLLGGLIPLGIATMKSGTAAYIANLTLSLLGPVSPVTLLAVIAVISTVFTLVVSNVGATVLLVPLVINMAMQANMDPRMAALVVGLATSNSFLLPTHQVNALYMGPGRYRSVDFIKAGSLMSVIFIFVMIGVIYLFYGIT
ncbi:MAG: SLC13 family permease [Deltaproteobacteria bacterium]|nr:SLC13 family permease [Deltaproteobacteria bacterium]